MTSQRDRGMDSEKKQRDGEKIGKMCQKKRGVIGK